MSRWDKVRRIEYDGPALPAPWQQQSAATMPPVAWGIRETPAYQPGGLETDAAVPAAQAALVGVCWGLVTIVISGILVAIVRGPWYIPPVLGACVWSVIMAWHVTKGVKLRQELLWAREEIERKDLGGDGSIGKPGQTLRVEVGQNNTTYFLDVPRDKATAFARSVLAGRGMSESEWKKFFGGIQEFKTFRGRLLDANLVRWVNPAAHAQGVELTAAGKQVFARLTELSPTE